MQTVANISFNVFEKWQLVLNEEQTTSTFSRRSELLERKAVHRRFTNQPPATSPTPPTAALLSSDRRETSLFSSDIQDSLWRGDVALLREGLRNFFVRGASL
jgi:hypothetical protein